MAQALPSFMELLESLEPGRDESTEVQNYARYPTPPSFGSSSPSESLSFSEPFPRISPRHDLTSLDPSSTFIPASPYIFISRASPAEAPVHVRWRSSSNRYSPYDVVPQNVLARRRSLPGDLDPHNSQDHDSIRASSYSPPMRRASLDVSHHELRSRLNPKETTALISDQPISEHVRRLHSHPHSAPSFQKTGRRSISPIDAAIAVSLPSLPPLPPISAKGSSSARPYASLTRRPPTPTLPCRSPSLLDQGMELFPREASRTPKPASRISNEEQ